MPLFALLDRASAEEIAQFIQCMNATRDV